MNKPKGMNNTHLKNKNRGLVLKLIATNTNISRITISKSTGLTKMTVTNIINELLDEKIITENSTIDSVALGRTPIPLDIASTSPLVMGLYLSRNSLVVLITDAKLKIYFRSETHLLDETSQTLLQKIYKLIDEAMLHYNVNLSPRNLLGIGISAIGTLDLNAGVILHPTNFHSIRDFPIVNLLKERYSLQVYLENDMNAAAIAEKLFGAGQSYDSFIYMGITNGVGAGIISNDHFFKNSNGFIGEIGHMSINFMGELCNCGNRGCLEIYATIPAIIKRLQQVSNSVGIITYKDFEALYTLPQCKAVFDDVIEKIAVALVNATNLLSPQCILIGHEGAFLPHKCIANLNNLINEHIICTGYGVVPVIISTFANESPLFGSVCCVLNKWFKGELF